MTGNREDAPIGKDFIKQIIRSDRRTLLLQVTPDASLIVRAPKKVSEETILTFVQNKIKWILYHQKKARESYRPFVKREFVDGETFLYLGDWHMLSVVHDGMPPLVLKENQFLLSKSFLSDAKKVFGQWYRKKAREVFLDRVRYYAETAGLRFQKMRVSGARKRWGSCGPKGTLNLSWRLIMAPMEVIDYVVVHELVHLEVRNHSRNFWDKVRIFYPNHQSAEHWLKANSRLLDF